MNDLSQAIVKLRALSPQLNAAAVEADRVVALVERFLAQECCLCVEAEVPLHFNDKGKAVTLLRYGSVNGVFRISVTHTDGATHFVTRPWSECDRNQRMLSFAALPRLLIIVAKAVEQQIASTTATAGTVGQILTALGASALPAPEPMPTIEFAPGHELAESELTLMFGDGADDGLSVDPLTDELTTPARAQQPPRMNGNRYAKSKE